jgi:GNAT superfamily N-acetyltransferase
MDADYSERIRSARVMVAEDDLEIIGVLVMVFGGDHLLVENVAVSPARQGQGLGRLLLNHAERQAAAAGLEEVRLYTHVTMSENRALYAHLGYTETGSVSTGGFERVNLAKSLGPVVSFRPGGPVDIEPIERHVQAGFDSYAEFAPSGWTPPRVEHERARTLELLAAPSTWVLIASSSIGSAGHVAFCPAREGAIDEPDSDWRKRPVLPRLAHLWQLFVLPEWWGTTVAAQLHDAAREMMVARGMSQARLYTPAAHRRARRFYERRGWRAEDQRWNEGLQLDLVDYRLELG